MWLYYIIANIIIVMGHRSNVYPMSVCSLYFVIASVLISIYSSKGFVWIMSCARINAEDDMGSHSIE